MSVSNPVRVTASEKSDAQASRWPPSIGASVVVGLLSGVLGVLYSSAYGGLVFSGALSPYAGVGIGMAVFGAVVHAAVIAATSSYPGSVGGVSAETAILGVVVAGLATAPGFAVEPETLLATVIVIIVAASALTGAVCLGIGRARLGNLVRYIPYPVMGGFVAGVGWLLLAGGMDLAVGHRVDSGSPAELVVPDIAWRWAPAVLTALLAVALQRRFGRFLIVPVVLAASGALFYLVAAFLGHTVADLEAGGWLLGPLADDQAWSPTRLWHAFAAARWSLVLAALPGIATYVATVVIGVLLVGAALELVAKRDVQLNSELRAAGWSNLAAALGGGFPGYHYIGSSSLHHRTGAGHRLTGAVAALVCLLVLFSGVGLLSLIPRPVAALLLFFMGFDLLTTWLAGSVSRLSRTDYLVVLAVFSVVVVVGFMEGVVVGLILGIALFAFNYSRIDVVKKELTVSTLNSRAARTESAQRILRRVGDTVPVYRLEGFIFFGTVNRLLERIRARTAGDDGKVGSVVLDFRNVRGLDSSAATYFSRLPALARRRDFNLVIAAVAPPLWSSLQREGLQQERRLGLSSGDGDVERRGDTYRDGAERVYLFETLDQSLEWVEEHLLKGAGYDEMNATVQTMDGAMGKLFHDRDISARFSTFGEKAVFEPGEALIVQGSRFEYLHFIRTGSVAVTVDTRNGGRVRLRSMGAGACVGEISMYLGASATAHVAAQTRTETLAFSRESLKRMREQAPDIYAALHEAMAYTLATRLADNTRIIDMLLH